MRRTHWIVSTLSTLCLLPVVAAASPTAPVTVTPVPDVPEIFSPGIRVVADLAQDYVEEEFFVAGEATVYTYTEIPDREAPIPRDLDVPYVTRIIVRRPANPVDFNGSLVIEWWNSTAGFDTAPVWDASAEFYAREGWVYVGLTNSVDTIGHLSNGCSLLPPLLPQTCIGRYTTAPNVLSMPENGQAYEMASQIANVLKSASPENPLPPGYVVERLYHAGQSQQGGSMVTYATGFHFPVNDGYFVQAASSARPINFGTDCAADGAPPYPDCTPRLQGDDRRVRTDLPVPVYRAMTESDMGCGPPFCDSQTEELVPRGVIGGESRQTDSGKFRYYEMPGTAHVTVHKDVEVLPVGFFLFPAGLNLEETCGLPMNTLADGPVFGSYLYNAMWWNMDLEVRYGFPSPHANLIDVVDGEIQADEFGNATGGIRLPMLEVPVGSYTFPNELSPIIPPILQGILGLFCRLSGVDTPFDQATLDAEYPSHGGYVAGVKVSAIHLILHRFLLLDDAATLIQAAKNSDVGVAGCGLGFELVFVLPPLMWWRTRKRRVS